MKQDRIEVGRLKGFKVIFEDDLYELANFLLKVNLAQDTPGRKGRSTVHGIVSNYQYMAQIDGRRVERMLAAQGIPAGASIEPDGALGPPAPAEAPASA